MAGVSIGIVGGGLIGLASAWRLAQAGFQVTVYERAWFGKEASWAGAGMLAPGGEIEEASEFASLAVASRGLYSDFVRELEQTAGIQIDYQECGALDLAYSAEEWRALEARAEQQRALSIPSKRIEAKQVTTFWPRVRTEGLFGALFYPGDAIVNPRDVVAALLEACRNASVELLPERSVERVQILGNEAIVETKGDRRRFRAVVVAAGAWSNSIPIVGVPGLPLVEPIKGHLIGYQQPEQTCNTIIRHGHTYLLQRANGLLIAGASVERTGWDRSIDPNISRNLAEKAGFVLPHLTETTPSQVWIGFRPGSEALRVGSWHSDALYLAYGHFRNGILLAPQTAADLTASLVAALGHD